MHIICSEKEYKDSISVLTQLPDGTTVVIESNKDSSPLRRMVLDGGGLALSKDFVDNERDWKRGEEAKFKKNLNADDVLDFFINHNDDTCPYREYATMSKLEHSFFCNISHSGVYYMVSDKPYNVFNITIEKDDDLDVALQEVNKVVKAQKRRHGKDIDQYFEISSHREDSWKHKLLFENGVWIVKAPHETPEFKTLKPALRYIQQNLWYDY